LLQDSSLLISFYSSRVSDFEVMLEGLPDYKKYAVVLAANYQKSKSGKVKTEEF
jgi:hypothetical protein